MKKYPLFGLIKILVLLVSVSYAGSAVLAQDLNPASWKHLKGYWKYQNVNNLTKATVGKDLVLTGTHQSVPGPAIGDTAIRIGVGSYYTCRHGMAPNGGGDSVNRYTLMFDFKVLSFKKWHTFHKTDSNNNNDGECFIRPLGGTNPGRIGVAATGYSVDSVNPNKWYRLMISVNNGNFYRYYLDGKLLLEGDTQDIDGRFALTPKMIFFGDDNGEDDTIDIASVAVFDTCLSATDIAKIGSIDPCVAKPPKISLGRDTALCDYYTLVKTVPAGFKKYQWYNGTSQPSITLTSSIGIGKKAIWCKATDANGCIAADTFVLTFFESAVIALGADQAFCEGSNRKLIAGIDTSYQYLWKFLPKGNTLSTKNSIIADSSGIYAVTVTTKKGCVSKDTIGMTMLKRPAKPTVAIGGKTKFCKGGSVSLDAPAGFLAYKWSNGLTQQSILSLKTETLRLKVIDNNNCESVYSDSVAVITFALPPKPKLILTGNDTFCTNDSSSLATFAGYKEYIWQDNVVLTKNNIRYVHSTGLYYVTIKDSNGCIGPPSDSVRITTNPAPIKPVIQLKGKSSICQGEFTQLSGPAGFYGYLWKPNLRKTQIDSVSAAGTYTLQVENTFGCWSVPSDGMAVAVNPVPVKPVVQRIGQKDSLQSDKTENHYRWYKGGVMLKDTNKVIHSSANSYYKVQTGNNYCWSVLSDSFRYTSSGIMKLNGLSDDILIYPNPTQGEFVLKSGSLMAGEATVVIADLQGREVYHSQVASSEMNSGLLINLNLLGSGIYQVKVISSAGIISGRIEKW